MKVSAAVVAARKEAEEKEKQRREQIEQQHAVQAALAQRQKVMETKNSPRSKILLFKN